MSQAGSEEEGFTNYKNSRDQSYILPFFPHHNFNKVQVSIFADKNTDDYKDIGFYLMMQVLNIAFYFAITLALENYKVILKALKNLRIGGV